MNLVLPGRAPETRFGENAQQRIQAGIPEVYADLAQSVFAGWSQSTEITTAQDVTEAIGVRQTILRRRCVFLLAPMQLH